jgi:hypothetical protein
MRLPWLAASLALLLSALAVPGSASVALPSTHDPSLTADGVATSLADGAAQPASLSIVDSHATLAIGGASAAFTASWTKHPTVAGQAELWSLLITGTSSLGAVALQGTWQPTVAVATVCTAGIPGTCWYQGEGPVALTGSVGGLGLDLAGVAFDTYSSSGLSDPLCCVSASAGPAAPAGLGDGSLAITALDPDGLLL